MLLTGDLVLFKSYPYMFLELDPDHDIYALVSIKYQEQGWVFNTKTMDDIVTEFHNYECTSLLQGSVSTMDDLCTKVGKFYEKYQIAQASKFVLNKTKDDLHKFEDELYTCDLSELVKVRKKWRTTNIELTKAQAKYDKDLKAVDSAVNSIAKDFDGELLATTQQMDTEFPEGTTVRLFGDLNSVNYVLILPDAVTSNGYLYEPFSPTMTVAEKGSFYDVSAPDEQEDLDADVETQLIHYVNELDKKLKIETQIAVYKKIQSVNAEAVKKEKDKEIRTYRSLYDEVTTNIELEKEKLESAEKSTDNATPEFIKEVSFA